jgi:hypothetical protein
MIRRIHSHDISLIVAAFAELGWDKPASLYQQYWAEQENHQRCVWVTFKERIFVGYITLKWHSEYAPFHKKGIPDIVNFVWLIPVSWRSLRHTKLLNRSVL